MDNGYENYGDPTLDPTFWVNAGGQAALATTSAIGESREALCRLTLPAPRCIMCQISASGGQDVPRLLPGSRLQAIVDWQSGRGNHRATVDIGPGTTFTLAAAQSVAIVAVLTSTPAAAANITIQCTLAPGSAANPMPARFSDVRQALTAAGGTFSSTRPLPAFARRMQLLLSDHTVFGSVVAQIEASANPIAQYVPGPGEWIDIPSNGESYQIDNNHPTNAVSVIPLFELAL